MHTQVVEVIRRLMDPHDQLSVTDPNISKQICLLKSAEFLKAMCLDVFGHRTPLTMVHLLSLFLAPELLYMHAAREKTFVSLLYDLPLLHKSPGMKPHIAAIASIDSPMVIGSLAYKYHASFYSGKAEEKRKAFGFIPVPEYK